MAIMIPGMASVIIRGMATEGTATDMDIPPMPTMAADTSDMVSSGDIGITIRPIITTAEGEPAGIIRRAAIPPVEAATSQRTLEEAVRRRHRPVDRPAGERPGAEQPPLWMTRAP